MAARTVAELLQERVSSTPNGLAYQFPKGEAGWASITWREAGERIKNIACGLLSLGLKTEERVSILSSTRIDWILADFGVLCGGGATTTIYPSNTPDECQFIVNDSGTVMVIAENAEQVQKLNAVRAQMPNLRQIIVFDGPVEGALSLADLEAKGAEWDRANAGGYEKVWRAVEPKHLATLIYTSGTTGKPKGVVTTHDCWVFEAEGIAGLGLLTPEDHQYLWLPLSHSFGKVLEVAQLAVGFPTTVDGRIPKLIENLAVIRPTFMAAAPRIFEKAYNGIISTAEQSGGMKLKIFRWAMGVGKKAIPYKEKGQEPTGLLGIQYAIADKLVFSKIRARFGGRIRFFISGSAALSREIGEFFLAAGIIIAEGYGLTESSAASFVNRPGDFRLGTVGKPVPGVKVKLEEDGEILLGGRGIMNGYHNLPDVTADTLTPDGWLRTGDIGVLEDGFLRITDRKKDLIKTSGGKYIAPQKLEASLKALCPYLSQVVVHGERRHFCSVLVTLDEDAIKRWAGEHGLTGKSIAELSKDPQINALVEKGIKDLNATLASYESIKKFAILERDFSVETGELTPSLKVKRKVVEKQYAALLDSFYAGAIAG